MVNGGHKRKSSRDRKDSNRSTENQDSCGRCGSPPETGDRCGVPNANKPRKTSKDSSGNGSSDPQKAQGSNQKESKGAHGQNAKTKPGKFQNDPCTSDRRPSSGTQTDFDKGIQVDLPPPTKKHTPKKEAMAPKEISDAQEKEPMAAKTLAGAKALENAAQTDRSLRELCELQYGRKAPLSGPAEAPTSNKASASVQAESAPTTSSKAARYQEPSPPSTSTKALPSAKLHESSKLPAPLESAPIPKHKRCCTDKDDDDCVDCTQFHAQESPLMLRYKAIIVDAKPTLQRVPGEKNEQSCQAPPSRPPSVAPAVLSRAPTIHSVQSEKVDEVEEAFKKLIEGNLPVVWVFGFTPVSAAVNKRHCVQTIAERNSLTIIALDEELQKFSDIKSPSVANGKEPKGLENKANYRGRKLADKVVKSGGSLTTEEICQLIKLSLLVAMQKDPPPRGCILDGFPVDKEEGLAMEENIIRSMCGIYFLNIKWSSDKSKEPKVTPPRHNFRTKPYSEKEAEAAADYFGFKTIKILNSEDLEDIQINDINALVKKHIDGSALELHKVTRAVDKNSSGPSYVLMDHHDFVTDEEASSSAAPYTNEPGSEHAASKASKTVSRAVATKPAKDVSIVYQGSKSIGVSSVFAESDPVATEEESNVFEKSKSFWNDPY